MHRRAGSGLAQERQELELRLVDVLQLINGHDAVPFALQRQKVLIPCKDLKGTRDKR